MIAAHTRSIFLSPITREDLLFLLKLRNTEQYRSLCSHRRQVVSLGEFEDELKTDFERDRHEQYCIVRRRDDRPIGTLYSYELSTQDGHGFVSACLEPAQIGFGYGAQALLLFVVHLFEAYGLFKVYADVYAHNLTSAKAVERWGFKEEGRFIGHRLHAGARYDLVRYAVYADSLERARRLVYRLGGEDGG